MKKAGFGVAVILLALAVVLGAVMQARHTAIKFPRDLVFGEQILDPVCVDIIGERQDYPVSIDPLSCRSADFVYEETLPRMPDPAFHMVHVNYQEADSALGGAGPFVAYKYIGDIQDGHVITVRSSGGGSGVFSAVRVVRREGDKLQIVEDLGGGDRCNGGIAGVGITPEGRVTYQSNATPFDLVALGVDGEPSFNAYDDLPACAACCAGVIEYVDAVPVAIVFSAEPNEVIPDPQQPMLTCYNDLVAQRIQSGRARLDMNEARAFSTDFVAACVKRSAPDGAVSQE